MTGTDWFFDEYGAERAGWMGDYIDEFYRERDYPPPPQVDETMITTIERSPEEPGEEPGEATRRGHIRDRERLQLQADAVALTNAAGVLTRRFDSFWLRVIIAVLHRGARALAKEAAK